MLPGFGLSAAVLRGLLSVWLLIGFATGALAQRAPVIIDTDAGSDDLMAIAFLLSQPSVRIEAITVVNGMAHVDAGARNVIRLLTLAGPGRPSIPVFAGRSAPLRGSAEFPADWRKASDEMPGVQWRTPSANVQQRPAADFLIERLKRAPPVRILALGPLTNLAEALERDRSLTSRIQELVIMGGAVRVAGNAPNHTVEWNMFIDPWAARVVFRSGVPLRLIPLDATNQVPIDRQLVHALETSVRSPLGRFVAQVLAGDRSMIDQHAFFAWDPLAAVALFNPAAVRTHAFRIDILQDPPEQGRTVILAGKPNADVALDADAALFRKMFLQAFER